MSPADVGVVRGLPDAGADPHIPPGDEQASTNHAGQQQQGDGDRNGRPAAGAVAPIAIQPRHRLRRGRSGTGSASAGSGRGHSAFHTRRALTQTRRSPPRRSRGRATPRRCARPGRGSGAARPAAGSRSCGSAGRRPSAAPSFGWSTGLAMPRCCDLRVGEGLVDRVDRPARHAGLGQQLDPVGVRMPGA